MGFYTALKLGTADVKITPPAGIPMAGYYSLRESEGVLDDIYAKAAVLDDGKAKVAMVVCDLIGLPRSVVLKARRLVEERTGIPASNVMISVTHTHTAPVVIGGSSREEAATGGSRLSKDYAEKLPTWIGQAVAEAYRRRTPACVSYSSENETKLYVDWSAAQTSPRAAKRLGTILAADVLKAYADLKQADDARLGVRTEVIDLPLAVHDAEELRRARKIVSGGVAEVPFLERVKAYRILDVEARNGQPFDVDVQVFTLGNEIAWVALPGEVFVELGRSIKAASPFRQTNVVGLANGRSSYIPHRSAFSEGQYEVISSRYADGAGELLVTTAMRLLGELYVDAD